MSHLSYFGGGGGGGKDGQGGEDSMHSIGFFFHCFRLVIKRGVGGRKKKGGTLSWLNSANELRTEIGYCR